jgi:hypothetical protein
MTAKAGFPLPLGFATHCLSIPAGGRFDLWMTHPVPENRIALQSLYILNHKQSSSLFEAIGPVV